MSICVLALNLSLVESVENAVQDFPTGLGAHLRGRKVRLKPRLGRGLSKSPFRVGSGSPDVGPGSDWVECIYGDSHGQRSARTGWCHKILTKQKHTDATEALLLYRKRKSDQCGPSRAWEDRSDYSRMIWIDRDGLSVWRKNMLQSLRWWARKILTKVLEHMNGVSAVCFHERLASCKCWVKPYKGGGLPVLRSESAQSFALWQQATIEITCHDPSIIACLRHIYMVLFFAHIPFVVNRTFNATPAERLQYETLFRGSSLLIRSLQTGRSSRKRRAIVTIVTTSADCNVDDTKQMQETIIPRHTGQRRHCTRTYLSNVHVLELDQVDCGSDAESSLRQSTKSHREMHWMKISAEQRNNKEGTNGLSEHIREVSENSWIPSSAHNRRMHLTDFIQSLVVLLSFLKQLCKTLKGFTLEEMG